MQSLQTNRIFWVDSLKVIAIYLVVLGHTGLQKSSEGFSLLNAIYAFHMPLFFLVSGMLYVKKLPIEKEIKKHFLSLIVPYLIYNAVFFGYLVMLDFLKKGCFDGTEALKYASGIGLATISHKDFAILPCFASWFFVSLFFLKCFASLYLDSQRARILAIFLLIALFTAMLLIEGNLFWHLDSAICAIPFFFAGYYMERKKIVSKIPKGALALICAISLPALYYLVSLEGSVDLACVRWGNTWLYYLTAFCGCASVISLCALLLDFEMPILRKISNGTMLIVALHALLLSMCYLVIKSSFPALLPYGTFTAVLISIAVVFVLIAPIVFCEKYAKVLIGKLR